MRKLFLLFTGLIIAFGSPAQKLDDIAIAERIAGYKTSVRGPYRDIRWFCTDGRIIGPRERCGGTGNVQHARYKAEIISLAESNHIFLGQILTSTDKEDFWDAKHYNSRMKQYQLDRYLRRVDDGWVLRRAQYYRGAMQIEDELEWGKTYLNWLLAKDAAVEQQYFLLREAVRDLPNGSETPLTLKIRDLSKQLGNDYPDFMKLRIKIHGQPEAADVQAVEAFREAHGSNLSSDENNQILKLLKAMRKVYAAGNLGDLEEHTRRLPADSPNRMAIERLINDEGADSVGKSRFIAMAHALEYLRSNLRKEKTGAGRRVVLQASLLLENFLFREANAWKPVTLREALKQMKILGQAAFGCGYLESWEWEYLEARLKPNFGNDISLEALIAYQKDAARLVDWGTGMIRGIFQNVLELYGGFEPLSYGFVDDKVRSGLLLSVGQAVSRLGDFVATKANFANQAPGLPAPSRLRGLNPGFASGELKVVDGSAAGLKVDDKMIYVFRQPPSDLKPVAGILAISEGNRVSHLQLLATNLGIPNASISAEQFDALKTQSGKRFFYAVSAKGTVILKPVTDMNDVEKQLVLRSKRNPEKVAVPLGKLDLKEQKVLNLKDVRSHDAGRICGPKAANLGELKSMFPEHVVEGLVIPFGIFRRHLDQPIPGRELTYWEFLVDIFAQAQEMEKSGAKSTRIDTHVLVQLAILREFMSEMLFHADFIQDLKDCFLEIFGKELGKVPVFVRSDTNMEDLKEFTGAGLNKTVFNVVDFEGVLQGIRDVWASPYRERGYRWRQKFLSNPENVYPSILIIPSVDVENSGVLITKGIASGDKDELTVAFSRGAGGAVEGQAAETWTLKADGSAQLLSPAREAFYRRLPITGGTSKHMATFEKPVLKASNLKSLRDLAAQVAGKYPGPAGAIGAFGPILPRALPGPYDIELGFREDKFWLFQIRPYVENKRAAGSAYLQSISPDLPVGKRIPLDSEY